MRGTRKELKTVSEMSVFEDLTLGKQKITRRFPSSQTGSHWTLCLSAEFGMPAPRYQHSHERCLTAPQPPLEFLCSHTAAVSRTGNRGVVFPWVGCHLQALDGVDWQECAPDAGDVGDCHWSHLAGDTPSPMENTRKRKISMSMIGRKTREKEARLGTNYQLDKNQNE